MLSIILPCYNVGQYLRQCLDSFLPQLSENVETICVDDGSLDDTLIILDTYRQSHPHFRVLTVPHGGVAAARNAGLKLAKGEYIAWIDPDDYVSPNWMTAVRRAIACYGPDAVILDMARFSGDSLEPVPYGRETGFVDREVFIGDVLRDIRIQGGLPDKILRARYYEGLAFDTELTVLEDFALMPRLLSRVESVYYLGQTLYCYRQRTGSLLHQGGAPQGFASVTVARERAGEVDQGYRKPATTAAALQALRFVRTQTLNPAFGATREQLAACEGYVRQQLAVLLADGGSPLTLRLKFFALGIGLYRPMLSLVAFLKKGEERNG